MRWRECTWFRMNYKGSPQYQWWDIINGISSLHMDLYSSPPSDFSQYWYRQPLSKYSLRYDKLLVDKDVYVFNELSGTVEQVGGGIQEEMDLTASSSPTTPYRSTFNQLSYENFTVSNREILHLR